MRRVEFHPEAQDEFAAPARSYEDQREGLGLDLYSRFNGHTSVCSNPLALAYHLVVGLRRVLLPKFPYGVPYRVETARIYVIAVMHLHRRPGYWRSRL